MSTPRQSVVVARDYRPTPDDCTRALELLLRKSVRKKGGPATVPNDDPNEFSKGSGIAKRKREDRM